MLTPRRAAFAAWLALAPDLEGFFEDLALLPIAIVSASPKLILSQHVPRSRSSRSSQLDLRECSTGCCAMNLARRTGLTILLPLGCHYVISLSMAWKKRNVVISRNVVGNLNFLGGLV